MVSIARREYESDWSWRDGSVVADPNPSRAAAAPARASAGATGVAREAQDGSGLGSEVAERSGGGGAATAVLEAPAQAAPSSNGATAAATGPAMGDPVEPKRVLYSYYTVRSHTSVCHQGQGFASGSPMEAEGVCTHCTTRCPALCCMLVFALFRLPRVCRALPEESAFLELRTDLQCAQ